MPENPRDEMIKWLKGDESQPSETDRQRAAEEAKAEREQAEQSKQIANLIAILALSGVGFMAWVAWSPRAADGTPSRPVTKEWEPPAIDWERCLSVEKYSASGRYIVGHAVNKCGQRIGFASVTFKLLDASKNVIGSAIANQSGIDADETWKFKAYVSEESAHTFTLDQVKFYK